jgi:N-methylhydantoinase B
MTLDSVTLVLVQNRLDHVTRQMGWVMMRTARSPIFSYAHDFSCFITDARGYIVSQSDGLPIHSGGGGFAIRALLKFFETDIAEEDVFLLSDPYAAGGNHLPDWVIARPVFVEGHLAAFCCNRAHQSDIGGGAAGTYNSAATEIFHEGLRIPPVRLVEKGAIRKDLWQLLLLNSRAPELMDGDLRAMLGSTRIGGQQVADLIAEHGRDLGIAYLAGVLDVGEKRMRAEIAAIPDGTYFGEDTTDNDCFEPKPTTIKVTVTIKGDGMVVDFTGTGPQIKGFKNSSIANSHSATFLGIASFLSPDIPKNEGSFRAIQLILPEGTIVNPRAPAPTTMNTIVPGTEIIHAIWKALGQAMPDKACAGWGKNSVPTMSGKRPDGSPYFMYHWAGAIGGGAVDGRDGFNANGGLVAMGALLLPDLELYEQSYPVRFLRQQFRQDSAGAGTYRGGTGIDYAVVVETPATLALRGEGARSPSSWGAAGGSGGTKANLAVHFADGRSVEPAQYGVMPVEPMTLAIEGAGGGGWGDPLDRDPQRVLRDLRDEIISPDVARDIYGVVTDDTGRTIDDAASTALRARLRTAREANP